MSSFLCVPKETNQRNAPDKKLILRVSLAVMGISKLASLKQGEILYPSHRSREGLFERENESVLFGFNK